MRIFCAGYTLNVMGSNKILKEIHEGQGGGGEGAHGQVAGWGGSSNK
jgi:hypothetical protein